MAGQVGSCDGHRVLATRVGTFEPCLLARRLPRGRQAFTTRTPTWADQAGTPSCVYSWLCNTNNDPKEHIVGMDALAVYVHKDNPLDTITIVQLGQIFGEDGGITKWSQLGIEAPGGKDEIIRVSRQSNSGTYVYFKETVVAKGKEFKQGSLDLHGSKDVVELVGKTPSVIGYSGMGYATDHVKMLTVSQKDGAEAYKPSMENAMSKKYPIARPLFMYTLGTPEGAVKTYLEWCLGADGQKVVVDNGYIPVTQ